ncbi:Cof-type HAD-IIB family hydrolase [Fusobacterium sp.]|uniref:Cof-type HAD-IIB family hydrolase n=1 Tax=Fusobacterium sp. TaxID=68766 RepID=UPI00260FF8AB|nr:Cof-type HAD-IIB family hydrolase [Fusobacterium sp.]
MKLVVSDLDGTLLNQNSQLSDETILAIRKLIENGVDFAFATGRGISSVRTFKEKIGHDIYLICNNGANIFNKDEEIIFERIMDSDIIEKLIKYFREKKVTYNGFYQKNLFTDEGVEESILTIETGFNLVALKDAKEFPFMTKIIVKDDPEVIRQLRDDMKEKFSDIVDITISQPRCLDIVDKDCSKGKGIKLISEKLNIPLDSIMAFGDGENDFDMLQAVGHPVVMENGLDSLKEKIENIAPKNIENGVAKYLEKYFNFQS